MVIRDTLPANTTFVHCAPIGSCSKAGGVVTFTIGTVAAGASGSRSVTVQVNAGASGTVVNTVTLDYKDNLGGARPQVSSQDTDAIVAPPPAVLALSYSPAPNPAVAGRSLSLSFTLRNAGPSQATKPGLHPEPARWHDIWHHQRQPGQL